MIGDFKSKTEQSISDEQTKNQLPEIVLDHDVQIINPDLYEKNFGRKPGVFVAKLKPINEDVRDEIDTEKPFVEKGNTEVLETKELVDGAGWPIAEVEDQYDAAGWPIKTRADKTIAGVVAKEDIRDVENNEETLVEKGEGERAHIDESIPENLDQILETSRNAYAKEYKEWKNRNRKNKWFFTRIANDLGFERQMPQKDRPQSLVEAGAAYMSAKKAKNAEYFSASAEVAPDGRPLLNVALLENVQEERELLQKEISEGDPKLEKGVIGKAFEMYSKIPRPARIALTTVLMTGVAFGVGTVGVGGIAAYAGARIGRSIFGGAIGTVTGKAVDSVLNRVNRKSTEKIFNNYATDVTAENYEQKENELANSFEKEERRKKRQRLLKGVAMATAAGATSIHSGHAYNTLFGGDAPIVGGNTNTEHFSGENAAGKFEGIRTANGEVLKDYGGGHTERIFPDGRVAEHFSDGRMTITDGKGGQIFSSHNTEVVPRPGEGLEETGIDQTTPDLVNEASVDLSPDGFIQDIENLKHKLIESYGGEENVPANIKENFLNQSPANLAQKLGFWDPEKGLSGTGLKGEHLQINSHGDIVYARADGADQILMNTQTGELEGGFHGRMVVQGELDGTALQPQQTLDVDNPPGSEDGPLEPQQTLDTDGVPDSEIPAPGASTTENFLTRPKRFGILDEQSGRGTTDPLNDFESKWRHLNKDTIHTSDEVVPDEETGINQTTLTPEDFVTDTDRIVEFDYADGGLVAKVHGISGFNGEIAHEHPFNGAKILTLDDKFQDGSQFKDIRGSFADFFDKKVADGLGDKVVPLDFEGGKIHIIRGVAGNQNVMEVTLNGKEIAKGLITEKGPQLEMIKGLKPNGLARWLLADNVYERAFKAIKPVLRGVKPN